MRRSLSDSFASLQKALEEYLMLRVDLVKLSVLEKVSKISVFIISALIFVLLGSAFLLFIAAAFVVWYGQQYGDYLVGLLIMVGFIFFLGVLFYLGRKSMITSTIIKSLTEILFDDDDDDEKRLKP